MYVVNVDSSLPARPIVLNARDTANNLFGFPNQRCEIADYSSDTLTTLAGPTDAVFGFPNKPRAKRFFGESLRKPAHAAGVVRQ